MKTLLVLLILAIPCAAQHIQSGSITVIDYQYDTELARQFEGVISAYAEDCWNDSTITRDHVHVGLEVAYDDLVLVNDGYYRSEPQCSDSSHYAMVLHRRPVTFEGFVNWLHQKHHKIVSSAPYEIRGDDTVRRWRQDYKSSLPAIQDWRAR